MYFVGMEKRRKHNFLSIPWSYIQRNNCRLIEEMHLRPFRPPPTPGKGSCTSLLVAKVIFRVGFCWWTGGRWSDACEPAWGDKGSLQPRHLDYTTGRRKEEHSNKDNHPLFLEQCNYNEPDHPVRQKVFVGLKWNSNFFQRLVQVFLPQFNSDSWFFPIYILLLFFPSENSNNDHFFNIQIIFSWPFATQVLLSQWVTKT